MTSGRRMFGFGPTAWTPPQQDGFAGKTVSQIKAELHDSLDVPLNAEPKINGQPVGEEHVVQADERLSFVMPNGVFNS